MFEKAQRYRECGAGITVHVNGMKAIKAISEEVYKDFESRCDDFDTFDEVDQDGITHPAWNS